MNRISALIASAGASAALISGAVAFSPTANAAADYFTVIAYSPVTGYAGWVNDASTLEEATHVALGKCQQAGDGCQVASWAKNACAALALGGGQWGGDWGNTANEAQANALSKVSNGRVVELHCT